MATSTHSVTNQAPPLVDYDVFAADAALREGVARYVGEERAEEFGRRNGAPGGVVVRLRPSRIHAYSGIAE